MPNINEISKKVSLETLLTTEHQSLLTYNKYPESPYKLTIFKIRSYLFSEYIFKLVII